ncbi:MAG: uracil-DNA glycosylase, partial [Haliea sp.]
MSTIQLEPSWLAPLAGEFQQPYMRALKDFLQQEKRDGVSVFPPGPVIFNAFDHTPLPKVKIIIISQDPYHCPGQAHGLCFSVRPSVAIPPSLKNIYKEIQRDLGIGPPGHGNLTAWADRGVLLLNSVLTVAANSAASHRGKGWETFTDRVVEVVNRERENVVF